MNPNPLNMTSQIITLSTATSEQPNWGEVSSTCHKLLRVSPEVGAPHGQDHFSPDPKSACITRCIGIISGMYDDETGISMEQLRVWWVDEDTDADFQEFKRRYLACAGSIVPEQYGDDYCKKSSKLYECFMQSGMTVA